MSTPNNKDERISCEDKDYISRFSLDPNFRKMKNAFNEAVCMQLFILLSFAKEIHAICISL